MLAEYDIQTVTPEQFRADMLSHGIVVLRGAVPATVVEPLAAAVQAMMDHYDAIPADLIRREMEREEPGRKNIWSQILNDGVHYNADLVAFTQGRHSLFDPINNSPLTHLLAQSWPDKEIRENFITNVRRVYAGERLGYGNLPLVPHIDAQFHQHDLLGINLWTPLTNAGMEEPGLAVIPMSVTAVSEYLKYDAKGYARKPSDIGHMHHFQSENLSSTALEAAGLAKRFERPRLQPGDVLAFTNYTIHATSVEPHMTKSRTSIEIRVLLVDKP